jgi:DNA modification methylase
VQLLSGNKTDLLQMFCEYAKKTIDVAVWVKTNPQPAMAEGVMTSAFEFVWMLTNNDMPTRRIAGASFQRGTFSNVFEHATASGHDASIHGAVFPVGVAVHFIRGLSQAKSLIYEPFCGSGTTLIAAEQLGRKCYGMEISPQYCDVIVKRWETLTGKKAELEASNGQARPAQRADDHQDRQGEPRQKAAEQKRTKAAKR